MEKKFRRPCFPAILETCGIVRCGVCSGGCCHPNKKEQWKVCSYGKLHPDYKKYSAKPKVKKQTKNKFSFSIKCHFCDKTFDMINGRMKYELIEKMGDEFWKIITIEGKTIKICPDCASLITKIGIRENIRLVEEIKRLKDLMRIGKELLDKSSEHLVRLKEVEKELESAKEERDKGYREIHRLTKLDKKRFDVMRALDYESQKNFDCCECSSAIRGFAKYILGILEE